jgi:ABC-2 type transport system permease protein
MHSLLLLSWAEGVKLLKRRLTWVLLVLLVGFLGMRINNIYGHAFDEPPDFDESPALIEAYVVLPEDYRQAAVLPGVFERACLSLDWLNIFLILLATLTVGQEFAWGTARTTLARGPGRMRLLLAKFVALTAVAAFYLLVLWIVCGIIGIFTTRSLDGGVDWSFFDVAFLGQESVVLARTWLIVCPVVALAMLLAVWARNPGLSLSLAELAYGFDFLATISFGGVLGLYLAALVEAGIDPRETGVGIMGRLPALLPHYNSAIVLHWGQPGKLAEMDRALLFSAEVLNLPRDPWRSLILLMGYGVVALGLALWIFRRKDVTT